MTETGHVFGGLHTETKLDCLRKYLSAYTTALKKQKFKLVYIDAFAGTGTRTETRAALPMLGSPESEIVTTEGSASIALKVIPAFNEVYLIEQDPQKIPALEQIKAPAPTTSVHIIEGDANRNVKAICGSKRWLESKTRGVIFLDPYGMEVEWSTVEAVAQTKALDCWYFFPLSGLYRNAPHDYGKLEAGKVDRIDSVLGTSDWKDAWYSQGSQLDMLDDIPGHRRREANVDAMETYIQSRLESVFAGSVLKPLRLYSNNAPLASLFFAMANPSKKANVVGANIAGHILDAGRSSQVRSR